MRVYDASSLPVNPALAGITKQYLVYMTENKLSIPPALLAPYTSGDATYLGTLGTQLNGYSKLVIDIEYLPTSPATIVWATDDAAYRAGAHALLIDWMDKFRVNYTGDLGFYGCLPNFTDYARAVVQGDSSTYINNSYAFYYQYAVDAADFVAASDTLYPYFYLDELIPGAPGEVPYAERMDIFTLAVNTTMHILRTLYPGKAIEPFITRTDLSARLEHIRTQNVPAHVWAGEGEFTGSEIAIMQYWNNIDNVVTPPGTISMAKKISELDASLEAVNPDAEIRIVGADGDQDTFIKFGTFADRGQHTGTQTLATISDAGALATKDEAELTDLANIASGTILANNSVSAGKPTALTAAQARTLLNVANGATANSSDAALRARSSHTGTQPIYTVDGLTDALGTIDANSVTADTLKLDISGTQYTVTPAADGTGPGGVGRALYIANASGTPSYGEVNITSGNIDIDENETTTVSVARTNGSSGAVTVTWTVSPGTHTTVDTGSISWSAGEPGTKTFTLTGEAVGSDITGGSVSIAVTSGSAIEGTTDSVTIATRDVPVDDPGVVALVPNGFPVGQSGTERVETATRSSGDGAIAVDWAVTPGLPGASTSPGSGTFTWADGDMANKSVTLTRGVVSSSQIATITLSNARRTDGGTVQPTIGTPSSNSFGISVSTNPGVITLTSTAISVDENSTLPIVVTRSGGSYGAVTCRWTIAGTVTADTVTGTLTWAAGETGSKSPSPLPIAGLVSSTQTGGTLTLSELSAGTFAPGASSGTITVNDIDTGTDYTLQDVQTRHPAPFAWATPVVVATTPRGTLVDQAITTSNVGDYTGVNSANANGKRLNFAAGTYGNLEIRGTDQEWVLTTGVIIPRITWRGTSQYTRITANPVRSGTIGALRVNDTIGELGDSTKPKDITLDGITQEWAVGTPQYSSDNDNRFYCTRLVVINCSLTQSQSLIMNLGTAGSERSTDWIWANNYLYDAGPSLGAILGSDTGSSSRMMGQQRVVFVDNYMYHEMPGSGDTWAPRHTFRIHSLGTSTADRANYFYVRSNLFWGAGHQFQNSAYGETTVPRMENIFYLDNLQYNPATLNGTGNYEPINHYGGGEINKPLTMTITGNTLYSGVSNYPSASSAPSGGTYTISGNTYTAGVPPTPPAWDFDGWRDPSSWMYEPGPNPTP